MPLRQRRHTLANLLLKHTGLLELEHQNSQRLQHPLIKEYTLNHIKDPTII